MNHTWVQPWFRPRDITSGRFTRLDEDSIYKSPAKYSDPLWQTHHMQSWKLRIRPDLATKFIPTFPYLPDHQRFVREPVLIIV